MRNFDYIDYPATLLTPETTGLLSAIHEFKGKQELFIRARKDVLDTLLLELQRRGHARQRAADDDHIIVILVKLQINSSFSFSSFRPDCYKYSILHSDCP